MLGSALVQALSGQYELSGLDLSDNRHGQVRFHCVDLTKPRDVNLALDISKPEVVIHTAAFTDVDGCELDPEKANSVNVEGTRHIMEAAKRVGAFLIHISTDYVFSGSKRAPYGEEDLADPVSEYGRSKLKAESVIQEGMDKGRYLIIRTSWLYGPFGRNFVDTIIRLSQEKQELSLPADHRGAPTFTFDLAVVIGKLIPDCLKGSVSGILNVTNGGETTWFDFAKEIMVLEGKDARIRSITSAESKRPARRPIYSVLACKRVEDLIGQKMRPWRESLREYFTWRKVHA